MDPKPAAVSRPGLPDRPEVIGHGVAWSARWTVRWLVLVAGAVVLGLLVQQVWSILLPVLLALIVTTVLEPVSRFLERRGHLPATLAAAVTVLVTVGLTGLGLALVVPTIASQAPALADSVSGGLAEVERLLTDNGLFAISEGQVQDAVQAAQDKLRSSASSIAAGVLVGVNAVSSALVNLVLTLVLTFLFLKDGRRFLPWVDRVVGHRAGSHLTEVGRRAWQTLGSFIRVQALVGFIDAVLIGIGLVVVGVPLAIPLAILTFVAAFVPVVGAIAAGALAVLVALVSNGWVSALIVLAIVLAVQQLEGNVLSPWLQGRSLRLHSAVVLLSVVLGSTLFGVAGAFLAVPVVAVAAVVLRYLDELVRARTTAAGQAS